LTTGFALGKLEERLLLAAGADAIVERAAKER
jgi:hypothetical protein